MKKYTNRLIKLLPNSHKVIVWLIIAMSILAAILIIIRLIPGDEMRSIESEKYSLSFDKIWQIIDKGTDNLRLSHGNDSSLEFTIYKLPDKSKFESVLQVSDKVKGNIKKDYPDSRLIYEAPERITDQRYFGHKLLFEYGDRQSLIVLAKKADVILVANYTSSNKLFDILLDSANRAINSFKLGDEAFNISSKVGVIKTGEFQYSVDKDICNYKEKQDYEIVDHNIKVVYSIPQCFRLDKFDSTEGEHTFIDEKAEAKSLLDSKPRINIVLRVYDKNIYEYLTKDEMMSFKRSMDNLRKDYPELSIKNMKSSDGRYIYKLENIKNRDTILIYQPIDNSHTLVTEVYGRGVGINENLIKNIKIKQTKKVGVNIDSRVVDGYMSGSLRSFADYKKDYYYKVDYKIPDNYYEQYVGSNKDLVRYFIVDPSQPSKMYSRLDGYYLDDYRYKVEYELKSGLDMDSWIKLQNNSLNDNRTFFELPPRSIHGINYRVFASTYLSDGVISPKGELITYKLTLVAPLTIADGGTFIITFTNDYHGGGVERFIPDDVVRDFAKISINKLQL